jgi:AcrR family transcriptional regulator
MADVSLRERKKTRTKRDLQAAALRLFEERGFDATTVDDIAAAADVSPRTFFRYFPTKEDAVIWDEYDPLILDHLAARPVGEPLLDSVRSVLDVLLPVAADDGHTLARSRLVFRTPSLRAREFDEARRTVGFLSEFCAPRLGRAPDDFDLRVALEAVLAVLLQSLDRWQRSDGTEDLYALARRGLALLASGLDLTQST